MISNVYMPWSSVSQISLIFFTARNERSEEPAMYNRKRCVAALRFEAAFSNDFCDVPAFGVTLRLIIVQFRFLGQFQSDKGFLPVAKIANDLANRLRQAPDERGNGDDLVIPRPLRFLDQINHFNAVLAGQVDFAKLLEIGECRERLGRLAGDVKTQVVMAAVGFGWSRFGAGFASSSLSLGFHNNFKLFNFRCAG